MHKWWMQLREEAPSEGGDAGGGSGNLPPAANGDNELKKLQDRVAAMEASRQPPERTPPPSPPPAANGQMSKADLEKMYWKDPIGYLQMAMGYTLQQAQNANADVLADVAKDRVRASDPEVWDALESIIMAKMTDVAPQYRANATVWQNAFNMAKGENMQKVLELKGNKKVVPTQDGPMPVTSKAPAAPAAAKLSDDEALFAKKMKLSADQYNKGKEFYNNQEAMWNSVITFDSDVKPAKTGAK